MKATVTRAAAKAASAKTYLGGRVCPVHGLTHRYTSSAQCVACAASYRKRFPKSKEVQRRADLKRRYGMTPDDINARLSAQNCMCPICNVLLSGADSDRPVVDHNHKTGAVRGLLCGRCNTALGLLRDTPWVLRSAADYLERNQ